jgi:hypothetical protein
MLRPVNLCSQKEMYYSVALKDFGFGIQFQRMLFIALFVLYLAVRLVKTNLLYLRQ